MKKLFFFLFATSLMSAQRIAQNETDIFTDNKIIKVDASTGDTWSGSDNIAKGLFNYIFISSKYIAGKDQASIYITLDIQVGSLLCMGPKETAVIFLMADKSKVKINQISNIDCAQRVIVDYTPGNTTQEQRKTIEALSTTNIDKMRVYTLNGYMDFDIKDSRKELIKNHFKLLLETIDKENRQASGSN